MAMGKEGRRDGCVPPNLRRDALEGATRWPMNLIMGVRATFALRRRVACMLGYWMVVVVIRDEVVVKT